MESVNDIKEALSARSRTATLDELRSEGRRRVRLVRAEHIAAMISEAVHAAIEQSGLIEQEEVDRLVDASRQEFRSILKEREAEVQRAHEVEEQLAERDAELAELKQQFAAVSAALAATEKQLEQAAAAPATAGAAPAPSNDLVMSLMQEMANMKASMMQRDTQPAQAGGGADFSAALEKLAGSLNDRLETIGKKMGVSAAVESNTPMDFSSLFADDSKSLESNMDNIEVKKKSGGGIAGNLARLKKLKGGS
jgi:chromosome segregation ATPase